MISREQFGSRVNLGLRCEHFHLLGWQLTEPFNVDLTYVVARCHRNPRIGYDSHGEHHVVSAFEVCAEKIEFMPAVE